MAKTAGTASVVQYTAPGGANYGGTMSAYLQGFDFALDQPEVRVTTLSDTDDQWVGGFKSRTVTGTGVWEATVDGHLFNMQGGTASPSKYFPQGTASGQIYYSFDLRVLSYNVPTGLDDPVAFSLRGRASNVTRGTV